MKAKTTYFSPFIFVLSIVFFISQNSLKAQTQIGQDIDSEASGIDFGWSVDLNSDGSILAIGATGINENASTVLQYDGNNWVQLGQKLDLISGGFGAAIAISNDGNIVAIGFYYNTGSGMQSGQVIVYEFDGTNWLQKGQVINGEAAFDWSGFRVVMNGDGSIIAISAIRNDGNGEDAGHVRIYHFDNSDWIQLGQDIDGEAAGDWSGYSISMNDIGDVIAIGAIHNDDNGVSSGHVRVYRYSAGDWHQFSQDIDGEAPGDVSGFSVSLNGYGNILAVGAMENDGNGGGSGHVRVYISAGPTWYQMGQDIDGEASGDISGYSVSLNSNGGAVAIGARQNDGNGFHSGHVRIFRFDQNLQNWVQLGQDIDGEAEGDWSGASVSLSGNGSAVAIGAPHNDGNGADAGHVRVFDLSAFLSVDPIDNELGIRLYPNPTNDYVYISGIESELDVSLYDIEGREVFSNKVSSKIDLRFLPSGFYFIKLSDGRKTSSHKLVKK